MANAIARFEPVTVCAPKELYTTARSLLDKNVRVVEMSMDDSWFRDTAAIFVKDAEGHVRGTHWTFNSWGGLNGGCYDNWDNDLLVAGKICLRHHFGEAKAADFFPDRQIFPLLDWHLLSGKTGAVNLIYFIITHLKPHGKRNSSFSIAKRARIQSFPAFFAYPA